MRKITLVLATAAIAGPLSAQTNSAVSSWIRLDAPPGHEAATAATLIRALPGWRADQWGNLTRTIGSGSPHRVVACALDYSAYVASQITDQGYLRVRRTGAPTHPLWNQFQEAQRVAIATSAGRVLGVVAVPNGHFASLHIADSLALTADQIWVDIGASSAAEVAKLGISLLDPVFPDRPIWTFGAYATGPAAGGRASCAAVAAAATGTPTIGRTTFVLSTQSVFGWVGLSAVLARLGAVDQLAIAGAGQSVRVAERLGGTTVPAGYRGLAGRIPAATTRFGPAVLWAGSTVESIDSAESAAVGQWVAEAAGLARAPALTAIPVDTARRLPARTDGCGALERQFMILADLPGVSGHERLVREAVLAALPKWARDRAQVDSAGNLIVTAGPDRDPMAVIAHLDEVGWEVDRILPNGQITLRGRGGATTPSWEGVPALLHFDEAGRAPIRGVFVPRDSGRIKLRGGLQAWFGMDSAELVRHGVRAGQSLTAYKRTERLAGTRITARGTDDRSGSTALLTAVGAIDPARLTRRVYFVWSVREEVGLDGAAAFGNRVASTLTRVYSIDTFVSSDTPLESRHFAFAPLGAGAVLRGLDDASLAPRAERDRVIRVARANGIPLQIGTTRGGTDGSSISPSGPPNVGLSWPGRYSHGPAEVLDLRDVGALARLVAALAVAP